jgi:hypothetical protein
VSASCLDAALARRAFARAWRVSHDQVDDAAIRAAFGRDRTDDG